MERSKLFAEIDENVPFSTLNFNDIKGLRVAT